MSAEQGVTGAEWLRQLAAECHRLAVARGKYQTPWMWLTAFENVIEELGEWVKEFAKEQMFGSMIEPRSHEEYGDLLHVVLSLGHQAGYDVSAALAGSQERNRQRIGEGA